VSQWEYLEVMVDLAKKTWKDSAGHRGKLRKNSVALALNELGKESWELAASLSVNGATHRLLFKRPAAPGGEPAAGDEARATGDASEAAPGAA
jgi:hypothetical protein